MPIKKIREYCELAQKGDNTLKERQALILEHKENILEQIKLLKYNLKEVEFKEWYYDQAIKLGSEKEVLKDVPNSHSLEVDIIPKTMKRRK